MYDNLLHLEEGEHLAVNVVVNRMAPELVYEVDTFFAGHTIKSGRPYVSASRAMSDARTLFYLLNGVSELMDLRENS